MRPILLTGLPRTGSTWASQAIAKATHSRLVHEPFNWRRYPDRGDYHMKYLPAGSESRSLLEILGRSMQPSLFSLDFFRPNRRPVVIKDVHICLALEYIWANLKPQPHIIILLRHPCGVANSWARLELEARSRLDLLLSQPELMSDHLGPYADHMERREDDYFEIGAYWGASYLVMVRLAEKYPAWQSITHETLCADPEQSFSQLLTKIGFSLSAAGSSFLNQNNRRRNRWEGAYSVARLTAAEPDKWRHSLTPAQIEAVMAGAGPFGLLEKFYP